MSDIVSPSASVPDCTGIVDNDLEVGKTTLHDDEVVVGQCIYPAQIAAPLNTLPS